MLLQRAADALERRNQTLQNRYQKRTYMCKLGITITIARRRHNRFNRQDLRDVCLKKEEQHFYRTGIIFATGAPEATRLAIDSFEVLSWESRRRQKGKEKTKIRDSLAWTKK